MTLRDLEAFIRYAVAAEQDEEMCFAAGRDAALNGANERNCHFSVFREQHLTAAWERGREVGKRERQQPSPASPREEGR